MTTDKDTVEEQEESLEKKEQSLDLLLIHASYVTDMFNSIFKAERTPKIGIHGNDVQMMLYDMALLYIQYDTEGNVICIVSLYDNCEITIAAELICGLKDIFKHNLYINDATYIQDLANNDLIWGRDNIDDHNEKIWGRKIAHSIMFDDTMGGNA